MPVFYPLVIMQHHNISMLFVFVLAIPSLAQAAITEVPTVWKYNEKVEITGSNLEGDEPLYKEFCIAPVVLKSEKKCYDEYDAEIDFETWNYSKITFYPPEELPVDGVVILHRGIDAEKCFGSAGCIMSTKEEDIELGRYKAEPYIQTIVDLNKGTGADIIRKGGKYEIKGMYFGERGDIFLVTLRSSRKVDRGDIEEWSNASIKFTLNSSNVEDALQGIKVNNTVRGSELWEITKFTINTTSAKSSKQKYQAQTFSDVLQNHGYFSAIQWAKSTGVLQGYPDETFKPDRTVNRAEFLKIVLEAKGGNLATSSNDSGFRDMDEGAWYAPYVRYAKENGIVQGYSDGTFKPEQAVNFAEALKMAYNTLSVDTVDVQGKWYERFLRHAQQNNVLYDINPNVEQGMSRKDVVWIVWKLMTHSGDWQQPIKSAISTFQPSNTSVTQFKDGMYVVGKDIQAGTYRTRKGSSSCYYVRLSGFSGELEDIIANEITDAQAIVTISASDKGFKSSGCGTWMKME